MTCLLATAMLMVACGGGDPEPLPDADPAFAVSTASGSADSTARQPSELTRIAAVGSAASSRALADNPPRAQAVTEQTNDASAVGGLDIKIEAKVAELNAALPLDQQTWSNINCHGSYGSYSKLSEGGLTGLLLPNGQALRFGVTADELDPARRVFTFRVGAHDPLTAGALRCEAVAPPVQGTALPTQEVIWYAVGLRVTDGRNSNGDDQLLTQWHHPGFPPFVALYLRDGKLRVQIRHNMSSAAKGGGVATITPWVDPDPVTDQWMSFVVQARISTEPSAKPFIKAWKDGKLLFSYAGPLGYSSPGFSYAKVGIYHWLDSGNRWDPTQPVKTMHVRRALIVRDSGIDEPILRQAVR